MQEIIRTKDAPEAIGPYSQAVKVGDLLFISGQIPLDPRSLQMVEGGIVEQTEQVMKNIGAILTAANLSYSNVVKCTCLLADMADFAQMNEVYGKYFNENPPARAAFAVKELPKQALVEIEAIATLA